MILIWFSSISHSQLAIILVAFHMGTIVKFTCTDRLLCSLYVLFCTVLDGLQLRLLADASKFVHGSYYHTLSNCCHTLLRFYLHFWGIFGALQNFHQYFFVLRGCWWHQEAESEISPFRPNSYDQVIWIPQLVRFRHRNKFKISYLFGLVNVKITNGFMLVPGVGRTSVILSIENSIRAFIRVIRYWGGYAANLPIPRGYIESS